jgi:hypothetical protein
MRTIETTAPPMDYNWKLTAFRFLSSILEPIYVRCVRLSPFTFGLDYMPNTTAGVVAVRARRMDT